MKTNFYFEKKSIYRIVGILVLQKSEFFPKLKVIQNIFDSNIAIFIFFFFSQVLIWVCTYCTSTS